MGGSGTERHSIAGLHLRFSIMETQRAQGAVRALPSVPSRPKPPVDVSPYRLVCTTSFSRILPLCLRHACKNGRGNK